MKLDISLILLLTVFIALFLTLSYYTGYQNTIIVLIATILVCFAIMSVKNVIINLKVICPHCGRSVNNNHESRK